MDILSKILINEPNDIIGMRPCCLKKVSISWDIDIIFTNVQYIVHLKLVLNEFCQMTEIAFVTEFWQLSV